MRYLIFVLAGVLCLSNSGSAQAGFVVVPDYLQLYEGGYDNAIPFNIGANVGGSSWNSMRYQQVYGDRSSRPIKGHCESRRSPSDRTRLTVVRSPLRSPVSKSTSLQQPLGPMR